MNTFEKLIRAGFVAALAVSVTSAYAADQIKAQDRLQTDMVEEPDRDRDSLRVDKDLQEPAKDMKKEQLQKKVKAHTEAKEGLLNKEQSQIRNQNMNRENVQARPNPAAGSTVRQNMMKR